MPHKRKTRKDYKKKLQNAVEIRNALADEYTEEKKSNARSLIFVVIMVVIAFIAAMMLGLNISLKS